MPNETFHVFKAERNEAFYSSCNLDSSKYTEWAIVVLFYICMHYVDAVLCLDTSLPKDLRDPIDHSNRSKAVALCPDLHEIASKYLNLYRRSRDARYNEIDFSRKYFNTLYTDYYCPVRDYLRKHLSLPTQ